MHNVMKTGVMILALLAGATVQAGEAAAPSAAPANGANGVPAPVPAAPPFGVQTPGSPPVPPIKFPQIDPTKIPDLALTAFSATAQSNQVSINFTIKNEGTGTANSPVVFLLPIQQLHGSGFPEKHKQCMEDLKNNRASLVSCRVAKTLAPGESVSNSFTVMAGTTGNIKLEGRVLPIKEPPIPERKLDNNSKSVTVNIKDPYAPYAPPRR